MSELMRFTAEYSDEHPEGEYVEFNEYEKLQQEVNAYKSALTAISNMCVGEMVVGSRLDAQAIGELIYNATGKTNVELNSDNKDKIDE